MVPIDITHGRDSAKSGYPQMVRFGVMVWYQQLDVMAPIIIINKSDVCSFGINRLEKRKT